MKTNVSLLSLTLALLALIASCGQASAQNAGNVSPQNRANLDPQQIKQMMQKRIAENMRDQLGITDDTEWTVIEQRLTKVLELRAESLLSGGLGMLTGMRRNTTSQGGGLGGLASLGTTDPATEKLQQAVDNKAPSAQIKSALAELRESRKQKTADLEKAQADLRSILTTHQEATLVLAGILD